VAQQEGNFADKSKDAQRKKISGANTGKRGRGITQSFANGGFTQKSVIESEKREIAKEKRVRLGGDFERPCSLSGPGGERHTSD